MSDLGKCTHCRIVENIDLLDGKSPLPHDHPDHDSSDFNLLECIRCYGPGWCPAMGNADILKTVAPTLTPRYALYLLRDGLRNIGRRLKAVLQ